MDLLQSLKKVKVFVFDVDGVLTDGQVLVLSESQWLRSMNIKDGYALQLAVKQGYHVAVISGGKSGPVADRLYQLGVTEVHMGVKQKKELLASCVAKWDVSWEEVLYMGDDIPDLGCMQLCGVSAAPRDAVAEIKSVAQFLSRFDGGKGCVREIIEMVLRLQDRWVLNDQTSSR